MNGCKLGTPVIIEPKTMTDLKDGQIAVITDSNYHGRVVQKIGNTFYSIGMSSGQSWSGGCSLRVRALTPGETIVVQ